MGLRENLSRLSPNEFLEKMQDMFQMYQESNDQFDKQASEYMQDDKFRRKAKSLIDEFRVSLYMVSAKAKEANSKDVAKEIMSILAALQTAVDKSSLKDKK